MLNPIDDLFMEATEKAKTARAKAGAAYQEWTRLNWEAEVLEKTASSTFRRMMDRAYAAAKDQG